MKVLLWSILLINSIVTNTFGQNSDDREIKTYKNILFQYIENDNYAYITDREKKYLFDIYQEDGGLMMTKVLVENENILAIVVGTYHNIPSPDIKCEEVSAMWYTINFYKKYHNYMLKLLVKNKFGHDGLVMCENLTYPYKTMASLKKKLESLDITNDLVLISLETFLKPNYPKKYDAKFEFSDCSFTTSTLKAILLDIGLTKKNLTIYNNIAYYLQKAGANEEAIYLLEKIIERFPDRTVAYYNIGDAYWDIGEKQKAIKAYTTYIEQMCNKGLQKKIPEVLMKRIEVK